MSSAPSIRSRRTRGGAAARALGYASAREATPLDAPEWDAQRIEIEDACGPLGLELVDLVRDHEPNGTAGRPGLEKALERIDAGQASCLIVSGLERLSSRVGELATVIDRLERGGVRLIALDVGLDTSTPTGRLAIAAGEVEAPPEPPPPAPALEPPPPPEPVAPPPEPPAPVETATLVRALGYASTPPDASGSKDLGEQKQSIEQHAEALGLRLVEVVREREPKTGKALDRAGLSYLIERIAAGDASCIVVGGLDRLSRSLAELGTIMQWLERNEVRLVVVDLELDTADSAGRATARALASVAGWERERISERTAKGLAAARAKRHAAAGVAGPDWVAVRKRIAAMRADGMTLQAIADVLNREGVPTLRGGIEWRPSSVQTAAGYKRRSRSAQMGDLPGRPPRST